MKTLVQSIINSGFKGALAITGGGTRSIDYLLRYGGGSKFLERAVVPYSKTSLEEIIGGNYDKSCSRNVASKLAFEMFYDSKASVKSIGLGATCSLAKENERAGREHHIYISTYTQTYVSTYTHKEKALDWHLQLIPGRTREQEEDIAALLILGALVATVGVIEPAGIILYPSETIGITLSFGEKIESLK